MSRLPQTVAGALIPERITLNGRVLDRRAFLGALGLTTAGAVLAGRLGAGVTEETAGVEAPVTQWSAAPEGNWHVDDMWGHWPRYAHPIPYSSVHRSPPSVAWDNVAPADRIFIA